MAEQNNLYQRMKSDGVKVGSIVEIMLKEDVYESKDDDGRILIKEGKRPALFWGDGFANYVKEITQDDIILGGWLNSRNNKLFATYDQQIVIPYGLIKEYTLLKK